MKRRFPRWSLACAAITCSVVALAEAPEREYALDIPPQPIQAALHEFSKQSGCSVMLMVTRDDEKSLVVGPLRGRYTIDSALNEMLAGSALTFARVGEKVITVRSKNNSERDGDLSMTSANELRPVADRRPLNDRAGALAEQSARERGRDAARARPMEEVVVTAQKRLENLQEVPVPVTAIKADSLVKGNEVLLKDYYTRVPGLNMRIVGNASGQVLSLRGVSTGSGNPTVGLMVDDVPYGGTTLNGGGLAVPDFDPGDLQRVEVLRGPQGTLYGASSMGGLLKYTTTSPSMDRVSGRLQVGASGVRNGDELGYNVRGSINVPLGNEFAMRASAFSRHDPGYVDNIQTGERAVNSVDVEGARVSALWEPTSTLSLKLSALGQRSQGDGISYMGIGLPDLQQSFIPGVGLYDRRVQAYSATLTAALGGAELTSLTGYSLNRYTNSYDYTVFLGSRARTVFGVNGAQFFQNNRTRKFTQEVRVSVPLGERIDWLVGGFYTDENNSIVSDIYAADPLTGQRVGQLQQIAVRPVTYEEYAAFTNLTFRFTDRFDLQVGGRQSHNDQTLAQVTSVVGAAPTIVPETPSKDDAFTYLITPRFRFSDELMVYARLASGYRPGGPNSFPGGVVPGGAVPREYEPDKTQNYEVGFKGSLNDIISFDASLYRIDWKDIQVLVFLSQQNVSFTTNGGKARSQGAELSVETRPFDGSRISAWAVWNDAVLADDFPAAATVRGFRDDRLPFSTRFSANLSIDQEIPLNSSLTGSLGASVSYIGERVGIFQGPFMSAPGPSLPRQIYPSFTKLDLRGGLKYGDWATDLFIANVTDERGAISGGRGDAFPTSLNYIQPRAIGLSVSKEF